MKISFKIQLLITLLCLAICEFAAFSIDIISYFEILQVSKSETNPYIGILCMMPFISIIVFQIIAPIISKISDLD